MRRILLIGLLLIGCRATGSREQAGEGESVPSQPLQAQRESSAPLAYIDGRPVKAQRMMPRLIEAAGGTTLADLVIDRGLERRLKQAGIVLQPKQIEREKQILLQSLEPEPSPNHQTNQDHAVRLLKRIRRQRGLGKQRFAALLGRNAGLRRLVRDEVSITDDHVRKAYDQRYGRKFRARLIVSPTQQQTAKLRRNAAEGASFATLAAKHSIDPSGDRGGLLSPISPLDAGYPQAVRNALDKIEPGEVTGVIGLESGYAFLKLVRILKPRDVDFDQVKDDLRQDLRRRAQRLRMNQLARTILTEADVTVLDRSLKQAWERQRARMTRGQAP